MSRGVEGEVVGASRSERFRAVEGRLGRVSKVLDELVTVPGTQVRVGLDPVIGLIPIVGDLVGAAFGAWLILEAARFRVPTIVLARMVVNLLLDLGIGAIPVIGDVYDVAMRSNSRNLNLFRRHALEPDASVKGQRAFFAGLALALIGLGWLLVWAIGEVLRVLSASTL
ncbi:MAG: DUF4112 domain-containing protein [Chloroflexi bacterium]|nr:DUF4112 domain-containing protein [Chloroflexota bacterium]